MRKVKHGLNYLISAIIKVSHCTEANKEDKNNCF